MPLFRKKPVIIQAEKLTNKMVIETPEGPVTGKPGDWLITGVKGEKYPCRDDIFQLTYEKVQDLPETTLQVTTLENADPKRDIPPRLGRGLEAFCRDMKNLGIPCHVSITRDGNIVQEYGDKGPVDHDPQDRNP